MTMRQLKALLKNRPLRFDLQYKDDLRIPVDYGCGIKWTSKTGVECWTPNLGEERGPKMRDGKRVATVNFHSWVGTAAIGAMHFYGTIQVQSATQMFREKDGKLWSGLGGYGPQRDLADGYFEAIRLDVTRRVTKVEKDMSGDRICKVGEWTNRFNEEKDVPPAAIKLFLQKFSPGWVLLNENIYEDEDDRPLATT